MRSSIRISTVFALLVQNFDVVVALGAGLESDAPVLVKLHVGAEVGMSFSAGRGPCTSGCI